MRILIASDSFKESLGAEKVCQAMEKGVKKVFPGAETVIVPMADGGEGTILTLIGNSRDKIKTARVTAPLGNKVSAHVGFTHGGKTAVVEMAQASGLSLVPPQRRNPMKTTSCGTGELIRNALDYGCKKVILTLGGVATNDAGVGMAQALGYRFLDKHGKEIPRGAQGLKFLHRIDSSRK